MNTARKRFTTTLIRLIPVFCLLISLVSLSLSTKQFNKVPEQAGITMLGLMQRIFVSVNNFATDTITSISELRKLRQEHKELLSKLEEYNNLERDYADIKRENLQLREQLQFSAQYNYQRIAARIVAKDPENIFATIIIDKGSEAGIRNDMPVVAFQDGVQGLVGRVIEAGRYTSVVAPLYNKDSYIAGRFAISRYEGLVLGDGLNDKPLQMKYISKSAQNAEQYGALIVTSGFESLYPEGIAIGRLKQFITRDYETSLTATIEPMIDFSRLEYIFVIMRTEAHGNG